MGIQRTGRFARRSAVVAGIALFLGAIVAAFVIHPSAPASVRLLLRVGLILLAGAFLLFAMVLAYRTGVQQRTLARREATLHAVAYATARFLGEQGWEECVNDVLGRLAEAVGASRAYVFENIVGEDGELRMDERFEWVAPGIAQTIQDPGNHEWRYVDGYTHWLEILPTGAAVVGNRDASSGQELADLIDEDIQSTVFVPIFASQDWWGFMGFDDCERPRTWEPTEVDLLKVVASNLGVSIERQRAHQLQRAAETRYRALVEHIPAITYADALNDEAKTLYMSPQVQDILGYAPFEWTSVEDKWVRVLHPEDRERAVAENNRHNSTGKPFDMEYRLIAKDGRVVWMHDVAVIVRDDEGRPLYSQGFMQDITAQKKAEEELAFLAYHDKRTGLPNRAMFEELLQLAVTRARRHEVGVAVLCLDVDDFKLVNDSLGHEKGDEVLGLLAERLREATRETDLVARLSGDQFLLLLSDLERSDVGELDGALLTAESVAERIEEALREHFVVGDTELYLSASIGISVFPHHASDTAELVQGAEFAMHQAKKGGRGGWVMSGAAGIDSITKLSFVTRLRKAVEGRHWRLHYQPVVELATGEMIGVEGLLRWQDPGSEMIPPGEFIPLAEELGLIESIGDWVVEEIAAQGARWRAEGLALDLGFNLSPRQLWQSDLTQSIVSRLESGGVEPQQVVVEITESSAVRDFDRWQFVLGELRAKGLRLALDDFGTGYSSLSRLRHLPIEILKIDRSFVSAAHTDPQAASIVTAIIELGRGLGMKTLAEGIETESEWRFLAAQGCQLGQGFYFSKPVPADEISARIRSGELSVAATARGSVSRPRATVIANTLDSDGTGAPGAGAREPS
jgi:diguanylate cyclase (GGDEF)-like protein/PAS domain S-box-containing protein